MPSCALAIGTRCQAHGALEGAREVALVGEAQAAGDRRQRRFGRFQQAAGGVDAQGEVYVCNMDGKIYRVEMDTRAVANIAGGN